MFGDQYFKTYPIGHFNFDNYKWWDEELEIEFNIHNHTVKRIYKLQIPKQFNKFKKGNKDIYWTEALDSIPFIVPNRTYPK